MIDFRKELAAFDFAAIDPAITGYLNEITPVIETFQSTLKRVSRELNQTNLQLEELLSTSQDEQGKDKTIAHQQETINRLENEKKSFVLGLIAVVDQVEDLYRYACGHESESRIEQISLLWRKISAELIKLGIGIIEDSTAPFDNALHAAIAVKSDRNSQNGAILAVVCCGYLYQGKVIRKAQVVVNKIEESSD